MHEQHAGVRVARDWLSQERTVHVGMPAWFKNQALAQVIQALLRPRPLLEHGVAVGRRQAVNDESQRLAGRVRVDGANPVNHH